MVIFIRKSKAKVENKRDEGTKCNLNKAQTSTIQLHSHRDPVWQVFRYTALPKRGVGGAGEQAITKREKTKGGPVFCAPLTPNPLPHGW